MMTLNSGQGYFYACPSKTVTRVTKPGGCLRGHAAPDRGRTRRLELAKRYYKRPVAIRTAIAKIDQLRNGTDLSETDLRVLVAIIATCLDKDDPLRPMFARKATLARSADCSEATFYRSYAKLQKCGVIVINAQQRYDDGSLGITTFTLSATAVIKLGLVVPGRDGEEETSDRDLDGPAPTEEAAGAPDADTPDVSLQPSVRDGLRVGPIYTSTVVVNNPKQSFGEQSVPRSNDRYSAPFVSREGKAIPTELLDLIDQHGFKATAVLRLMKIARQTAGHLLGDIYALVKPTIDKKGLTGPARYAYLRRCALDPTRDWTRLGNQHRTAVKAAKERDDRRRRAWQLVGSAFRGATSGNVWRVVLVDGSPVLACQAANTSIPLTGAHLEQILKDIDSGTLQALETEGAAEGRGGEISVDF